MKKRLSIKQGVVLLTSVSAVAMLAACDTGTYWKEFYGERDPQFVEGTRHVPPLNQGHVTMPGQPGQPMPAAAAAPMMAQPAQPQAAARPVTPPNPDSNPYDYYDASGNVAPPPPEPKPAPAANASQSNAQGGFFDRVFANNKPEVRKPLPGNSAAANETTPTATAPVPPTPQAMTTPKVVAETPVEAPSQPSAKAFVPVNDAERSAPPAEMAEQPETPSAPVASDSGSGLPGVPAWAIMRQSDMKPSTPPAAQGAPMAQQAPAPVEQAAPEQAEAPAPAESAPPVTPLVTEQQPAKTDETVTAAEPIMENPVKPKKKSWFARNFGASEDTQPSSPATADAWPSSGNRSGSSTNTVSQTPMNGGSEEPAAAPAPEPTSDASEHKPASGLFSHLFGKEESKPAEGAMADENAKIDADRNAATPALSSVPATPDEFKSVKSSKAEDMKDLQNSQVSAEQEKQDLQSEPSQQSVTGAASAEPAAAETAAALEAPSVPEKPAGATGNEPVLLGHASAPPPVILNSSEAASTDQPAPAPEQAPAPVVNAAAMQPAEEKPAAEQPARRPSFWDNWKSDKKDKKDSANDASADNQDGQPVTPLLGQQPVAQAPQVQQPTADNAATPPLPVVNAAQEPASDDTQQPPAATADSELPSPTILEKVKTLPPSRYSSRMQAVQPPAAGY